VNRRAAIATLAAGLGLMITAQLAAPLGSPPLYDGVIVQEPYRYLLPGQNQIGSPTSYQGSVPVTGTTSPEFVAATTESPPQAQLIAQSGSFVLPAGVTSLEASVEPVAAPIVLPNGTVVGNVYRISVADQSGAGLTIGHANIPTLSMRAPTGVSVATIAQFVGGAWREVPTESAGQPGIFLANVTELGDFALIEQGGSPGGLDSSILVIGVVITVLSAVVLAAIVLWRRSRETKVPAVPPPLSRPSKRRRGGGRRQGGSR
jgi:hypothetical protein